MDTSDEFTTSFITLRKLTIAVIFSDVHHVFLKLKETLKQSLSNNKLKINMNGCNLERLRKIIMK